MVAYYNEIDPYAAQWLRNLIEAGLIAPGVVDERDIRDITPDELREYTQCHFFAGIGVWSLALRSAGWPDDRPVWTGSCPCQPFSAAGRGKGPADERHLWPHWFWLIAQCNPDAVFGEQVASKDGLGWLDLVQADLEGTGYSCGGLDLCAAGFGAPHIRQRIYFAAERMADVRGEGLQERKRDGGVRRETLGSQQGQAPECSGDSGVLAHADSERLSGQCGGREEGAPKLSEVGRLGHTSSQPSGRRTGSVSGTQAPGAGSRDQDGCLDHGHPDAGEAGRPGPTNGHWSGADWLGCRDGKFRPVEPGTFPLADGIANRVGRLRAYGNAIVAPQATAFVEAFMNRAVSA